MIKCVMFIHHSLAGCTTGSPYVSLYFDYNDDFARVCWINNFFFVSIVIRVRMVKYANSHKAHFFFSTVNVIGQKATLPQLKCLEIRSEY